jgi:flagellar basal-body rod modification protein FlgD
MAIDGVSTVTNQTGASSLAGSSSTSGMAGLSSADFFKILVSELKQQDPLAPTKTADMISQVSQIRSIELSQQLTSTLGQLSRQQKVSGTADLIGKYVQATVQAADGTQAQIGGLVTGVRFDSDGSAVLELDSGQAVSAADVTDITTAEQHERAAQAAGGTTNTTQKSLNAAQTTTDASKTPAPAKSKNPWSWLGLDGGLKL